MVSATPDEFSLLPVRHLSNSPRTAPPASSLRVDMHVDTFSEEGHSRRVIRHLAWTKQRSRRFGEARINHPTQQWVAGPTDPFVHFPRVMSDPVGAALTPRTGS